MSAVTLTRATLDDLHAVKGKAELIGGKVVHLMPTGSHPNRIGGRIFRAIDDYANLTGRGVAYTDNAGFAVPELSSGRESFSPDASYYLGPTLPDDMDFLFGPPAFAVEVRSKSDYGSSAEDGMAAKRADYFEAGTLVVWDVDPMAKLVRVYRQSSLAQPDIFGVGESADAEPVMPGWRLEIESIFV